MKLCLQNAYQTPQANRIDRNVRTPNKATEIKAHRDSLRRHQNTTSCSVTFESDLWTPNRLKTIMKQIQIPSPTSGHQGPRVCECTCRMYVFEIPRSANTGDNQKHCCDTRTKSYLRKPSTVSRSDRPRDIQHSRDTRALGLRLS